jgi:hypothetical protein
MRYFDIILAVATLTFCIMGVMLSPALFVVGLTCIIIGMIRAVYVDSKESA